MKRTLALVVSWVLLATLVVACTQAVSPTPTPAPTKAVAPAPGSTATAAVKPTVAATAPAAPQATIAATQAAAPKSAVPAAVKPLSPAVPVKVGILSILADAGIFIAVERGYFKEEGLDVQLVTFVSGAEVIPPLATGELQIGSGSVNPGFFNAVARGLDLKIVADKSKVSPQLSDGALIARKDLYDSGQLKELSQLKGKSIALNLKATTSEMYVERIVEKAGLKLGDVNLVEMPFPDVVPALANKAVDAAWTVEPFISITRLRGLSTRLIPMWDIYPDHFTSVLFMSPVFAKGQPEAAKRFIAAYLRGIRDHYEAVVKKSAPIEPIVQLLMKYTAVKDPALFKQLQLDAGDPDGYIKTELLAADQDYYVRKGYIKDKVDTSKVVDFQYVEYALQRLGKYK